MALSKFDPGDTTRTRDQFLSGLSCEKLVSRTSQRQFQRQISKTVAQEKQRLTTTIRTTVSEFRRQDPVLINNIERNFEDFVDTPSTPSVSLVRLADRAASPSQGIKTTIPPFSDRFRQTAKEHQMIADVSPSSGSTNYPSDSECSSEEDVDSDVTDFSASSPGRNVVSAIKPHHASAINSFMRRCTKITTFKKGQTTEVADSQGTTKEKRDELWRYIVETILTNAALAKSATAMAVFGGPYWLAMSSTALAPPPPDTLANNNKDGAVQLYQPQKEEDQFMELIFPGFDGDTFIWNTTLAQIAFFAFTMAVGHTKANPTPCALYMLGASWGPAIARGQLWRLFCPMMLHANLMHLFFNVFFQLRIGFGMEKQFGTSKMRVVYVMCGVIGNLISVMLDPFKLAVGASTAGFGLIGVWVAEIIMSWELLGANRDRTLIWILFMVVSVTSMSGMTPNMDLYGHFGGAFGGFLIALIMADMKPEHRPPWYNTMKRLAWCALFATLGAGAVKLFMLTPIVPIPDCHLPDLVTKYGAPSFLAGVDWWSHMPSAIQYMFGNVPVGAVAAATV